mgnify:CR=1 FL=1
MKLSTKGRYAMVALADLAMAKGDELVSLAEVSRRQDISLPYLEQLFVKLRRSGLVEAVRGPGGGYKLARSPNDIRISEVLEAVEDIVSLKVAALGDVNVSRADDRSRPVEAFDALDRCDLCMAGPASPGVNSWRFIAGVDRKLG